jgi:DNA uptake protein ComE-like DNA-binding protein
MMVGEVPMRHTEEFYFDPNTADSTQLLRLGLPAWMIRNIYRYRARGGVYRSKRDFAQTYGLTKKDYLRLEPYIRISDDYQAASTLFSKEERDTLRYPAKLKDGEYIVLNTADTTELMKVPGIGSYYAKEIVRHGKWIGGYVSVDQLDEIKDFPQTAKKYFVVSHPTPQRLNINKLSLQELRRHPYINYYQAKAIIDYRRLHGNIKSLQDLRFSKDFTESVIRRLKPYVEY